MTEFDTFANYLQYTGYKIPNYYTPLAYFLLKDKT